MHNKILSAISQSSKSSVYLVDVEGMDVPAIYKVMSGDHLETYEKVRSLESEYYPRIYSVHKEGDKTAVLEEFVVGDTLDRYIEEHHLSESEIVGLMLQVCEAVKLLHSQKPAIIHRDIKPSNILVDEQGRAKIIDFDIVREYDLADQKDTRALGTVGYAPPEQYGYAQTDERSDIYAIGSTLYELLFHKRLSCRDKDKATHLMFPKDQKVHRALIRIIEKCTSFSPDSRYSSVEKLERDLKHYKTKRIRTRVCAVGLVFALGAVMAAGIYQNVTGDDTSSANKKAAEDSDKSNTTDYKGYTIDTINGETGERETFTLFFMKNRPELSVLHIDAPKYLGRKEKPKKIRLENMQSHLMLELASEDWKYDDGIVTLKPESLQDLQVKEQYSLIMEFSDAVINAQLDVIDSYAQMANKYSSTVSIEGGGGELIRESMSEIRFCIANSLGRKITKIVNADTKEEIDPQYYSIDEEKQTLTFDQSCFANVKTGERMSLLVYTEVNQDIPYNEPCSVDVVVRDHPYQAPQAAERNYIIVRKEQKDLEIFLEWNDGKDHFQNFYMADDTNDVIPDEYVSCKENSIVIKHEFFDKMESGVYEYIMEFGDVGMGMTFTVK